jgi:hypothetical protein
VRRTIRPLFSAFNTARTKNTPVPATISPQWQGQGVEAVRSRAQEILLILPGLLVLKPWSNALFHQRYRENSKEWSDGVVDLPRYGRASGFSVRTSPAELIGLIVLSMVRATDAERIGTAVWRAPLSPASLSSEDAELERLPR